MIIFNKEKIEGHVRGGTCSYNGDKPDISVLNGNAPARTQPGLWCEWEITETELRWNEAEKFYDYEAWLEYLINHFFEPLGYVLNGEILTLNKNVLRFHSNDIDNKRKMAVDLIDDKHKEVGDTID